MKEPRAPGWAWLFEPIYGLQVPHAGWAMAAALLAGIGAWALEVVGIGRTSRLEFVVAEEATVVAFSLLWWRTWLALGGRKRAVRRGEIEGVMAGFAVIDLAAFSYLLRDSRPMWGGIPAEGEVIPGLLIRAAWTVAVLGFLALAHLTWDRIDSARKAREAAKRRPPLAF